MDSIIKLGITAQKYTPAFLSRVFTRKVCSSYGKSTDFTTKYNFAKKYKINHRITRRCSRVKDLKQCIPRFKTLDDIFSRKILSRYTRPVSTKPNAIVSPAECMGRIESATDTFLIKDAPYTLSTLLDIPKYKVPKKSTVYIFRLAPEHYHRIHSPVSSKITNIHTTGGEYKSVNPILLDDIPVLQTNHRKILTLENGMYFIAIGATCVGTIELSIKSGSKIEHGQDLGTFKFGGSCLVLVVPQKISKAHIHLTQNESFLRPGQHISDFKL